MKSKIAKIVMFTIVIGVLGLAFNNAFGSQTILFLTPKQINLANNTHFYIWKFDFWTYIDNFQLSLTDLSILRFELPTRTWSITWDIGNNMALILDYIIMIINILLYPLKVGAYLIRNLLAILGINTDTSNQANGLAWLVQFVNNILGRIAIPYI